MAKNPFSFWATETGNVIVAITLGLLVGYNVIPKSVIGIANIGLMLICIYFALQFNISKVYTLLPYICFNEIVIRAFVKWTPYLTVQYFLIVVFLILLTSTKLKRTNHSKAFVFLLIFVFIEIVNGVRAERTEVFRQLLINSIALFVVVFWASITVLTPQLFTRLFQPIKNASIYLAAIILVAHLKGNVEYIGFSSREASNGLAPVQLSGYLGMGCVFFFFSIMDRFSKNRWLNIAALAFCAINMILTFSRGGLYFLVLVVMIYMWFNRQRMGQYFKFVFFIPVAYLAYTLVTTQTEGKIEARYKQAGASNREILINAGIEIFTDKPVFGVGTGNFSVEVKRRNLFMEESGAHNEFIRAAAEHGLFGIFFYWGFFFLLIIEVINRRTFEKHYGIYLVALFCLISVHNGLKISIQPLILMMAVGMPSLIKRKKADAVNRIQYA